MEWQQIENEITEVEADVEAMKRDLRTAHISYSRQLAGLAEPPTPGEIRTWVFEKRIREKAEAWGWSEA